MKTKRQKISIAELTAKFPTDQSAEAWFIQNRWGDAVHCPSCGSVSGIYEMKSKRTLRQWRCKSCVKNFTVKTGTLMASSHLGCRTWLIALYLVTISLKGIASTKLAADLAITQKTAWHLAMRIRETYNRGHSVLTGEVEIDESYFGGAVSKMSPKKRKLLKGKGPRAGKQIIIGAKERDTGKIITHPIPNTKAPMLEGFVHYAVDNSAQVYTDDNNSYNQLAALGYKHKKVNHSAKQYVDGMASTQGIESFWALMKRGYHGIHHFMSFKHLGRYAREFAGKQADRKLDTMTQMELMAKAMTGKQLSFTMLKGC